MYGQLAAVTPFALRTKAKPRILRQSIHLLGWGERPSISQRHGSV